MSLTWFFRFADRTNAAVLPLLFLFVAGGAYAWTVTVSADGVIHTFMTDAVLYGVFTLFSALPAYILFMVTVIWRRTHRALNELEPALNVTQHARVRERLDRMRPLSLLGIVLGVIFGATQNEFLIGEALASGRMAATDAAMVIGNCVLWGIISLMLCWRLPVSAALSKLGETMSLDIYRLDKLKPLGRLATMDILVVAGAMAFMPLQSLDAELRLDNYLPGMLIGVPAAIILFVLPLWGVHNNIVRRKHRRLQQLHQQLDRVDRADLAELELVTAHIERVRTLPNWPIDVRLLTRIFFYAIIAPLAWVGAALVENLVDRF